MEYSIETGIEIPDEGARFPFKNLEVGQTFLVPGADKALSASVRSSACAFARRHKVRFTVRKVDEGVRVWRVE